MLVRFYEKTKLDRRMIQSANMKILPNVGDIIMLNIAFTNPLIVISRKFIITSVGNLDFVEMYVETIKNEH